MSASSTRTASAIVVACALAGLFSCATPRSAEVGTPTAAVPSSGQPSTTATTSTTTPVPTCPKPPSAPITQAPAAGHARTVALTFDDGPGSQTLQVGELLAKEKIRATFFLTGLHHQKYPDEAAKLVQQGHLLANHSYDHRYPTQVSGGWTVEYLTQQLRDTNTALADATGQAICWFRPPGGFQTNVRTVTANLSMGIAMWDVDSLDWKQTPTTSADATQAIVDASTTVSKSNPNHPMVLLHSAKASREPEAAVTSNRSNTLAALPGIIEWYRSRDYVFVDLSGRSSP